MNKDIVAMAANQDYSWIHDEGFKAQARLLEMVAYSESLDSLLKALVLFVERFAPQMRCSILLADQDAKVLRHGAAPNLPTNYNQAVDGLAIRDGEGSCGTAAARRELVIVADIATSPLWRNYRELAREAGVAACWSMPVFDSTQTVIGTCAMYYDVPRSPAPSEIELIRIAASVVAIVVQRFRDSERLRINEVHYRELAEGCPDAILAHHAGQLIYANQAARDLLKLGALRDLRQVHLNEFVPEPLRAQLLAHESGHLSSQLEVAGEPPMHVEIRATSTTMDKKPAVVLVLRDVSRRIATETERIQAENRQQEHLAFDLHDGLGQQLTGISLLLGALSAATTPTLPALRPEFQTVSDLVTKSIGDIRILAGSMSPVTVDEIGLAGALKLLRQKAENIYGLDAHLALEPIGGWTVDTPVAHAIFRIVQEAIGNVARHAKAARVDIDARTEGSSLVVTVTDDGIGISDGDFNGTGLGLRSMRHHAAQIGAKLEVTRLTAGTQVRVRYCSA